MRHTKSLLPLALILAAAWLMPWRAEAQQPPPAVPMMPPPAAK